MQRGTERATAASSNFGDGDGQLKNPCFCDSPSASCWAHQTVSNAPPPPCSMFVIHANTNVCPTPTQGYP